MTSDIKNAECAYSKELPLVTKQDIIDAFIRLGVSPADSILIHSSLKSFGFVDGGAMSVIDAAKQAVTEKGTVVFPTLVQRDFKNAYQNWDVANTPSDVGAISETFRQLPDSIRSDQATHSVAAWGSRAKEITGEHTAYGPRMGIFGDYCFSYSSPWQKMYFLGTRIIFIGIDMVYNTFKHFAEYMLVEHYCSKITDIRKKCTAMSTVRSFTALGIWPLHDGKKTQAVLDAKGLVTHTICGNSNLISIRADEYVNYMFSLFLENPQEWFDEAFVNWIQEFVPHGINMK